MRSASRRSRQRLLGEAFEQGIRHFDVARMYGLGAAEGELGRFAHGRRDQITTATKLGIDPSSPAGRLARFEGSARTAFAQLPALRAAQKRREGTFHAARHYDPKAARESQKQSFGELGIEHFDLLFIHDLGAAGPIAREPATAALEELRQDGYIGAWGGSGEVDSSLRIRNTGDVPIVLQLRDDILDPEVSGVEFDAPVIHEIDDLFIASSSTFPTSRQANSTFKLIAFAVRFADHLRGQLAVEPERAVEVAA